MGKWKCDRCKTDFENYHAQGYDNEIYCPLCFYKEKQNRLIKKLKRDVINITEKFKTENCDDIRKNRLKAYRTKTKEILRYLED